MSVWDEVWRLRQEGAASRGVRRARRAEDTEPPLGGWAPILDDEGVAHGEPPPTEPTDAPAPGGQ